MEQTQTSPITQAKPARDRALDRSLDQSAVYADAVETSLAHALTAATAEGRWDVVAQLAKELEARRLSRRLPS